MAKKAPVQFRDQGGDFRSFMEEWSLRQAEANHVETIEEANDFNIEEDDEDILHPQLTVYEMHEAAEDNLAILQREEEEARLWRAESNETAAGAQDQSITENLHDQSAPGEPVSPAHSPLSSQEPRLPVDTNGQQAPQ